MKSHNATSFFGDYRIGLNAAENRGKRAVLSLGLTAIEPRMNRFQEMVRARLRDKTPNFSTLAEFLHVDPSVIQKRFKDGGSRLCLDFLDSVTPFYQMSVAEMTAIPGAVMQEVKPLEAQLLGIFRDMTELQRHSLLAVLDRGGAPLTRRQAKAGHKPLSDEQQRLADLYEGATRGAQKGAMNVLLGSQRPRAGREAGDDAIE